MFRATETLYHKERLQLFQLLQAIDQDQNHGKYIPNSPE